MAEGGIIVLSSVSVAFVIFSYMLYWLVKPDDE